MTIPSELDPLSAPWWPVKRIARLFKVTPRALYDRIGPDGLPAIKVSESWRIVEEVLRCWIREKLAPCPEDYDPLVDSWVTVRELATTFDVSPGTIYGLARAGRLPALMIGGVWRFPERLIRDWALAEMKIP